jgi:hypothetical protein
MKTYAHVIFFLAHSVKIRIENALVFHFSWKQSGIHNLSTLTLSTCQKFYDLPIFFYLFTEFFARKLFCLIILKRQPRKEVFYSFMAQCHFLHITFGFKVHYEFIVSEVLTSSFISVQ